MGQPEDTPSGFAEEIGIEWLSLDPDDARARIAVDPQAPAALRHRPWRRLRRARGEPHLGGHLWGLHEEDMVVMAQANDTSFLRPIGDGYINAAATPRHRGRTTWVWDAEITDDDGRVCALARMTIAVRPRR